MTSGTFLQGCGLCVAHDDQNPSPRADRDPRAAGWPRGAPERRRPTPAVCYVKVTEAMMSDKTKMIGTPARRLTAEEREEAVRLRLMGESK